MPRAGAVLVSLQLPARGWVGDTKDPLTFTVLLYLFVCNLHLQSCLRRCKVSMLCNGYRA